MKAVFQFNVLTSDTLTFSDFSTESQSRVSELSDTLTFSDCSTEYQMWHTTLSMACALQFLINLPQSTSPLEMEGTRKDSPPSKRRQPNSQFLIFQGTVYFIFLTKTMRLPCSRKSAACHSRSLGTRPSGSRASGTPSWTSRTGRTRTTPGTATRTGTRWPPTPCGSPTGTGSRRTTPPTLPCEETEVAAVSYALVVPHDQ